VVNRLADLWFHTLDPRPKACKSGLLRVIFDPQIGVALKSLHEKVGHRWTVESLAVACGMSRSAFAVRFKDLVGETLHQRSSAARAGTDAGSVNDRGNAKLVASGRSMGGADHAED
jgi:AraC-like DNA-binding protein